MWGVGKRKTNQKNISTQDIQIGSDSYKSEKSTDNIMNLQENITDSNIQIEKNELAQVKYEEASHSFSPQEIVLGQTKESGSFLNRIKGKPSLMVSMIASIIVVLMLISMVIFFIVRQTEQYNEDIAVLEQSILSYQEFLDNGLNSESAEFPEILSLYADKLSNYKTFNDQLKALNRGNDYIFAFGKRNKDDIGITKLETDAQFISEQISETKKVMDDLSALEQSISDILKTKSNTIDEVIIQYESIKETPNEIKQHFDTILLPQDLQACNDYVYNYIDALENNIVSYIDYYSELKPIEQKVAALNQTAGINITKSGDTLKLIVAYFLDQSAEVIDIIDEITLINKKEVYVDLKNKVDISAFALSDEAAELVDISGFLTSMNDLIADSEALDMQIDAVINDNKTSISDKQTELNDLITKNDALAQQISVLECPDMFSELFANYQIGVRKRSEALAAYIEYLDDYASYLSYKKTANEYWSNRDYYFDLAMSYGSAGDYSSESLCLLLLSNEAESAQHYEALAANAKTDYEAHYKRYATCRELSQQLMGIPSST